MSGDLEDFLRRAAQRRQAKSAQQEQQQPPPPRPRPQYTDRHTERVVDAIIVEEPLVADNANSLVAQKERLEESRRAAALAEAEAARRRQSSKPGSRSAVAATASSGNSAQELVKLLSQPGGLGQAFLLREILDRPEHRW